MEKGILLEFGSKTNFENRKLIRILKVYSNKYHLRNLKNLGSYIIVSAETIEKIPKSLLDALQRRENT